MRKQGASDWVFLFASFGGRISRREFWIGFAVLAGIGTGLGAAIVTAALLARVPVAASACYGLVLALLVPLAALSTKRWHDRNRSGCRSLVVLIPVAGPLYLIYELGFVPGMSERFAARPPDRCRGLP